jgi:hypothetical protein
MTPRVDCPTRPFYQIIKCFVVLALSLLSNFFQLSGKKKVDRDVVNFVLFPSYTVCLFATGLKKGESRGQTMSR